ncbi:putative glycoside hydrolase [Lachnospiraceae bacterium HCP1S3_A8]|nr:putative glycoside hydrolase [Lachnospiraceae bacterium]
MRKIWGIFLAAAVLLSGCKRYDPVETTETPPPVVVQEESTGSGALETEQETEGTAAPESVEVTTAEEPEPPERRPVKVKGIYLSAHVAGNEEKMQEMIQKIDETEINAVVIDVKDDNGRITFQMDQPLAEETGAVEAFIPDIQGLMDTLKEHNIYTIARVVSFRDPYLAEKKPELALKLADGSLYRDKKGMAWVNPYKQEMWDYLVDVGIQAHQVGFDEIQFDYIRFSTEKGIGDVVYDEADVRGRDKKTVITEFVQYASEKLKDEGAFVAADVFGAVMGGGIDSDTVGQSYGDMANQLDYICPMIYPSHYGDGNFGIEHPDTQPYDTILAALQLSREDLSGYKTEGQDQAAVRPWLQDFTASYLKNYIKYGNDEIRAQIQAVYDAGYEEWLLWSAACNYHWEALHDGENSETR